MGRNKTTLVGNRFGRLLVIERVSDYISPKGIHQGKYLCHCDCGNDISILASSLVSNKTVSCGCRLKETNENFKTGLRRRKGSKIASQSIKESDFLVNDTRFSKHENRLYSVYRFGASKRGIDFDLSIDLFIELTRKNCFYCGIPPLMKYKDVNTFFYNGVDRVDNKKGYLIENCVPCCWDCNRAKGQNSIEKFIDWIKRLKNIDFDYILDNQ